MKTVSLELSQQLKEAGYPQLSTRFFYFPTVSGDYELLDSEVRKDYRDFGGDFIASPTSDEILEQLPAMLEIEGRKSYLVIEKFPYSNHFEVSYINELTKSVVCMLKGKVLANVLAEMWLYLKENNLLEVKG